MTQDEFYSLLMQDVEYIFKTGFKLSPEMFMQTMSYASEQYQLLLKRIEELEIQLADANSYFDGIHTELEAPKTCEGCRYLIENSIVRCRKEVSIGIPFSSKEDWFMFGCNRYMPKYIQ